MSKKYIRAVVLSLLIPLAGICGAEQTAPAENQGESQELKALRLEIRRGEKKLNGLRLKEMSLVIEVKKGHEVYRCPTGEHIYREHDIVGLTSAFLVTAEARPLAVRMAEKFDYSKDMITTPGMLDALNEPSDWSAHYEKKHTAIAPQRQINDSAMFDRERMRRQSTISRWK